MNGGFGRNLVNLHPRHRIKIGSGSEIEHALQRRADPDEIDVTIAPFEFFQQFDETAGAGAVEVHDRLEIDAEAGVAYSEGGVGHTLEFRPDDTSIRSTGTP